MLIPDVNILVYTYNTSIPQHPKARTWFEAAMNGSELIGISSVVVMGFIRILSNPNIVNHPGEPARLAGIAESWLRQDIVRNIVPGNNYLEIMRNLFTETGASGKMTTDIFLATLALSLDAVVCSNDNDFLRIPGLRHFNPLE